MTPPEIGGCPEAAALSGLLARLLACDPVRAGDWKRFPQECGVYAFEDGDRALWVGQAASREGSYRGLRQRMHDHTWPNAGANIATRRTAPRCSLARHLAAEALGRPVKRWPPPPGDRAAVLEALARVRGFRVRYVLEPDPLALPPLEKYVRARLRPEHGR